MEESIETLAEERLNLEREALKLERERLDAERNRLQREHSSQHNHTALITICTISSLLFFAFAFSAGIFTGMAISRSRQNELRESKLEKALSKIGNITIDRTASSNSVPDKAHSDVSVLVIQ